MELLNLPIYDVQMVTHFRNHLVANAALNLAFLQMAAAKDGDSETHK